MFPVNIHGEAPATFREITVKDGDISKTWNIPSEFPVAFVYNRRNYAVMMATPADAADFAIGFSLTEQVVSEISEIKSLEIYMSDKGIDLRIKVAPKAIEKLEIVQRRRNLIGQASCGLCGLENADALFIKLPKVGKTPMTLAPDAIRQAIQALPQYQILNKQTKTVHGAGWANLSGEIVTVREDVGRHNALDKLLGALALAGTNMTDGFVVMSSRCSYEIIEKAARRKVRALVAISGPTEFAIEKAKEAGMSLYFRHEENFVSY